MIPLFIPDIQEQDILAATAVMRSGMLVQGPNVAELEAAFCKLTGARHAVAVSNGTATLHLILHALGIGPGDEVIIPAFSYVATANVVELVGAKPVFVDVQPDTWNIDPAGIEAVIHSNTKAIIPVHEFGLSADLDPIRMICNKHNLFCIEDAACAAGATYNRVPLGKDSYAASFSLHPRKAITSGEGGMILTSDAELAARLRIFRNHGIEMQNGKMEFVEAGFNYRMTDFQAALVLSQTHRLFDQIQQKSKLAEVYAQCLNQEYFQLPSTPAFTSHTWQTFHIIPRQKVNRDMLFSEAKNANIGLSYGAQCIPDVQYYKQKYKLPVQDLYPNAFNAFHQGIALPMYASLTVSQAEFVANTLNTIIQKIYAK
ncbi:MAG: DegT/DnrJ/EryC1/StrS family aminotransferase [Bacteroidetes bacterium]|nr:DegT/DnrJ/EryC1/StrS family aminotransferase [Bacteroidota bacterium]